MPNSADNTCDRPFLSIQIINLSVTQLMSIHVSSYLVDDVIGTKPFLS